MSPAAGHDSRRVLQDQVFIVFIELPRRLGLVQLVLNAGSALFCAALISAALISAALMLVSPFVAIGHRCSFPASLGAPIKI